MTPPHFCIFTLRPQADLDSKEQEGRHQEQQLDLNLAPRQAQREARQAARAAARMRVEADIKAVEEVSCSWGQRKVGGTVRHVVQHEPGWLGADSG